MMHSEIYCTSLDHLNHVKAIRAIHQALLQLQATSASARLEGYDHSPAIQALTDCMRGAGHIGFDKIAVEA